MHSVFAILEIIGYVRLGHSKERYRAAYSISAAKDAASANSGAGRIIADGEMGDFMENLLNVQFSQSNESTADSYGFDFMVKHGYDYHAMEGAFQKLADLSGDGGKGSMMSSHPGSAKRAENAKLKAEKQDKKG
ncbi:M48 family metalloprotease [Aequorivita capsosiphonis]|uniref:M48 family metalloprotease n=1 Tax=Aequorivita capsosiphonis TaxID=487317 RepID=UPI0003FDF937|nr:M48 family metalloprotease [Aequorivita capsosiphonis]